MNYLAHAYLSFEQPGILAGNMISDFVKGKKKFSYPPDIQSGMKLHREIDQLTDIHPAIRNITQIFKPAYRLYGAAITDVVLDHFLANDTHEFNETSLLAFTENTYRSLDAYQEFFPETFRQMYPFMKSQNWLFNYRYRWGIEKSLGGLVRRATYMKESDTAFRLFNEHFEELKSGYEAFFPDVKLLATAFCRQQNPG
jgi:acyl carrier protein phosphodiesterase